MLPTLKLILSLILIAALLLYLLAVDTNIPLLVNCIGNWIIVKLDRPSPLSVVLVPPLVLILPLSQPNISYQTHFLS